MPVLLRKIEANVLDNFTTTVTMLRISGELGMGDHIKIGNGEFFLQNLSQVNESEEYPTLVEYGLKINKNKEFIELEISY
jgi:hypothetical protein